jgi:HlyD family secretion protein
MEVAIKAAMNPQFTQHEDRPTGAAMDQALPRPHVRKLVVALGLAATVLCAALAIWQFMPRGLQVPIASTRIATVERGLFRDDVAVRASAAPLHSVVLDAVESGRVEEVFARDGAVVKQGDVLFRLSNPQRRLDLLAREAEHAQQISNLTNLRVALETSRAERRRRTSDLAFAVTLAQKQHARNIALAQQGVVSAAALEDSADRLAQQRRSLESERSSNDVESATQSDAVRQMEQAIARLDAGLVLANATIEALAVRAPVAGRLTDFRLQVGETVTPDQHLGRIDDLERFKISAQVDEYYLNRVLPGRAGSTTINGRTYPLTVSRIYPQIKDGKFTVELGFDKEQPDALSPGQSAEVSITLGGSAEGLLLPNDAFIQDSGGLWVFVIDKNGVAQRRAIRTGRRNHSQVEVLDGLALGEKVLVSSYAAFSKAERLQLTK